MSSIEWTDRTWNPITGCTKISEGCRHCYAEAMAKRLRGRAGYPEDNPFRVTLHRDKLEAPLHWRKPSMVFPCSMSDMFHPDVTDDILEIIWNTMNKANNHIFQVLTKRPERMKVFLQGCSWLTLPRHIWCGTTVENYQVISRIIELLDCPVQHRFLSVEPLLSKIDFTEIDDGDGIYYPLDGKLAVEGRGIVEHGKIDWVIVGCESRPGKRVGRLPSGGSEEWYDWAANIVAQCTNAGIPIFVKQIPNCDGNKVLSVDKDFKCFPSELQHREFPIEFSHKLGMKGS